MVLNFRMIDSMKFYVSKVIRRARTYGYLKYVIIVYKQVFFYSDSVIRVKRVKKKKIYI